MKLSSRALQLQPSATLGVVNAAKALEKQGKNVISFGAGEPDFTSPPGALLEAHNAIDKGKTHYTAATGIPELREAVQQYYIQRFALEYPVSSIVIGAGAKPCLLEALACILDPGDEALLLAPSWVSYVEQIRFLGGLPVIVDTEATGFVPDMDVLEKAVTPRTRVILLNSPCNPTGIVYSEDLLREIGKFAKKHDLWILWDEIYERLVYGKAKHWNILQVLPELKERTILINGVSKAYAMTGWRIGYVLGPEELMKKVASLQGHFTSNPCSIAQWAALGALRHGEEDVLRMHKSFEKRRNRTVELLSEMPHISFPVPEGAFYVMVNIQKCLGKKHGETVLEDDSLFCTKLLEEKLLATVPGTAFLAPGHLRISYANAMEEIEEGMRRLKEFLTEIY